DGQAAGGKSGEHEQQRPPAKPKEPTKPPKSPPSNAREIEAANTPGPVKPPYEIASESARKPIEHEEEPAAPPSVRRLLREHHLRARDVEPTGEGGRLLRDDVLRYAEEHATEKPPGERLPASMANEGPALPPGLKERPREESVVEERTQPPAI